MSVTLRLKHYEVQLLQGTCAVITTCWNTYRIKDK